MSDFERGELPKWFRGPVSNAEKLNMRRTPQEVIDGIMQRIKDAREDTLKERRVSHDEHRDLGHDDQRDQFSDGPGEWGWSWDDEEPQPRED